jgi:2',3'-cyclic-nucleotide 2'-phosphodiesterase (5'-nucleotidase family)
MLLGFEIHLCAFTALGLQVTELEKPDIIVPMTHQNMPFDRELAEMEVGFPVIIGGHDHELYSETVKGAKIIKVSKSA